MLTLRIFVNGRSHQAEATPDTPLLYVLRNELRLNAAKYGCGLERCGACTVHVDGAPVHSCVYPVGDAAGAEITTLEGLGAAERLHPLQQAFLDEQAAQCGYCTSGMIMTAAALLGQNSRPDDREIRLALEGTLCRCGSDPRILRAVKRVVDVTS
ncbi:MAG: (2Fe-2S)-binding protein [Chloroflexota bacterium]|nr:(2Fe-2S)-binding protein [Chloroflexota bacterium]